MWKCEKLKIIIWTIKPQPELFFCFCFNQTTTPKTKIEYVLQWHSHWGSRRGQSALLDSEKFAKNREKRGRKSGKSRNLFVFFIRQPHPKPKLSMFCSGIATGRGGRKRLPKFKFSAKFPIGLHVILQIQIKKFENDCYLMWKIILTENPSRFNVEPLLK